MRRKAQTEIRPRVTSLPKPWFLGAGWRLYSALFVTLLAAVGLFVFLTFTQARLALKEQAVRQNVLAAELAAKAIEKHFEALGHSLEDFARRRTLVEAIQKKDDSLIRSHLRDLVTKNLEFDRAVAVSFDGILWSDYPSDPAMKRENFSIQDWYQGVSEARQTYVSEVYQLRVEPRRFLIDLATPIRNGGGNIIGYLAAQHAIENLSAELAQIRLPLGGRLLLIDQYGHVITRIGLGNQPPLNLSRDPLIQEVLSDLRRDEGSLEDSEPVTGERGLISYVRMRPAGWVIIAIQSEEAALAPLQRLRPTFLMLTSAFLGGLFLLHALALHLIRRSHRAQKSAERALVESEQWFQGMVESVVDYAIVGLDRLGFILTWNRGAQKIKGYETEEILGQHFSIFYPEEDRARSLPQQILEEARSVGRSAHTGWQVRKDGTRFWAEIVMTAVFNERGQAERFSKVTRDLTENQRVREALMEKNRELERLANELMERTRRLQRFHSLTVERELDMKGLKGEVNSLREKLGEQKKY